MNIAICDDEKIYVDKIAEIVSEKAAESKIKCNFFKCYSGQQLIKLCDQEKIDAIFLDIVMAGINGFETARELMKSRKNLCLVFVSANESVVFDSYEFEPVWFVPKSRFDVLETAVKKVFERVSFYHNNTLKKFINIEGNKVIEIDLRDVAFFKTEDHYVKIIFNDSSETQSYRCKLDIIEQQLFDSFFVRIHKRFLVNCRSINSFSGNRCILLNNFSLPVSRTKSSSARKIFCDYLRRI